MTSEKLEAKINLAIAAESRWAKNVKRAMTYWHGSKRRLAYLLKKKAEIAAKEAEKAEASVRTIQLD